LGALIALDIWQNVLKNNTVSIYNDNGGAARALISKAPALHRSDMQCLTREIAKIAIKNNIMFWGVKIDGKFNEYADHVSRFYTKHDWEKLGFQLCDIKVVTNKYIAILDNYYPNCDEKIWSWTDQQKAILLIQKTDVLIENKETHKPKPKQEPPIHNILTKKEFEDWLVH
jgi:hypothetical protein